MTDAPQEPIATPTNPGSPTPPPAESTGPIVADNPSSPPAQSSKKRFGTVGVIAALAVGAVVGGASGAGVGIWAISANNSNGAPAAPTSITVNNSGNVSAITAAAAKAAPSVVTINVTGGSSGGTGSGVVLTADGYIVTNTHVVTLDGATANGKVQVETSDGRLFTARVIGTDPIDDLAVIKVDGATNFQPAQFADSSKLNVGDMAIAIGAPLGLSGSVTNGIVSALNRSITVASSAAPKDTTGATPAPGTPTPSAPSPFDFWNFDVPGQSGTPSTASSTIALSVIQTDAAINPGNSGGALLDSEGKVIGINVAIASAGGNSTSGSIGVGFAIPANIAQRIAQEIIKTGSATHGLLGASIVDVTEDPTLVDAKYVGASVQEVTAGGAAANAGIRVGDVITNFNGIPITNKTDLTAQVRALPSGAHASVTFIRNGQTSTVTVTLGVLN